jgi:hypothetical protein
MFNIKIFKIMEKQFNVKVVECKGFTKDEALKSVSNFTTDYNATTAWINAGKPTVGTPGFKAFCAEYLKKKTKANKGVGCYITLEAGSADTRMNPYKVFSIATTQARKFKRVYQIMEAEIDVKNQTITLEDGTEEVKQVPVLKNVGVVVEEADKKSVAEDLMKQLISLNKRSYFINIVNKCVEGEPVAAYGVYTPSTSAKVGTYIAFGVEMD